MKTQRLTDCTKNHAAVTHAATKLFAAALIGVMLNLPFFDERPTDRRCRQPNCNIMGSPLVAVFVTADMTVKWAPPDNIQGELKAAQDFKLPDEIVADIRSRASSRLPPTTLAIGRPPGAVVATPAVKDGPPAVPTPAQHQGPPFGAPPAQTLPPAVPPSSASVVPAAGRPTAPPTAPSAAPSSSASVEHSEARTTLTLAQTSEQNVLSEAQVLATAKSIEDQLRTLTAAFNIPKTVRLNNTTEIALIIDGTNTGAASRLISEFPGAPNLRCPTNPVPSYGQNRRQRCS